MHIYICQQCGHLEFGAIPINCPVCYAPKENFIQNDNIFIDSQKNSSEAEVKHIPSIKIVKTCGLRPEEGCIDALIRIGATLHPMLENHYIQFIDTYIDKQFIERIHLTPNGVNPAGCIHIKKEKGLLTAVENCNVHGYWMKDTNF